jgi:hypothetical protein
LYNFVLAIELKGNMFEKQNWNLCDHFLKGIELQEDLNHQGLEAV